MAERDQLTPENFDEVTQEYLVQGLVVKVEEDVAHYIIIHVLDGEEEVLGDDFYPNQSTRTADKYNWWFSELPPSYRLLWQESQRTVDTGDLSITDTFELTPDIDVEPGDTVHVHNSVFWKITGKNSKEGYERVDVCKLPVPNIGVQAKLELMAKERAEKVKQALADLVTREENNLAELERIRSGLPFRPFPDPGKHDPDGKYYQSVKSRYVYGEGPVADHFVDISAKTAYEGDVELGGTRRFAVDGTQYVELAIMPFGPGTREDHLYELRIHVNSMTKLNPAVGEVRPVVLIDGQKYEALLNPEESSSAFENPGHDIVFDGFRREGVKFDTVKLTEEQIKAIDGRFDRLMLASRKRLYERLSRGEDIFPDPGKGIDDDPEAYAAEQAIIDTIAQTEPAYTVSGGVSILLPRSMLDAIEVRFDSLSD